MAHSCCSRVAQSVVSVRVVLTVLWLSLASLSSAQQVSERKAAEEWQVRGILAALDDPLPEVQAWALDQIAEFSKVEGVSTRLEPYLTADSALQRSAVRAIGAIHATKYAGAVARLLKDPKSRDAAV